MTQTDGQHKLVCVLHNVQRLDYPPTIDSDGVTEHPGQIHANVMLTFDGMAGTSPVNIYIRDQETALSLITTWINYLAAAPGASLPTADLYLYMKEPESNNNR